MKNNRLYIFVAIVILSVLACGLPVGGSGSPSKGPTNAPSEVQGDPFISAPAVANIKLLTEVKGIGVRPLFVWDAVSGASRYQLIVFDDGSEPYWAWEGTKTQIYMGGTDAQPPADSSGPSIGAGYSWTVVAYGSDGKVLAASNVRPISP